MKKVLLLIFHIYLLVPGSIAFAEGYTGFKQVKAKDCVDLDQRLLQKLPAPWHKYKNFIKICPLKKNMRSKEVVSIVSLWTEDYLNMKEHKTWEEFPQSIIIDENLNEVGTLPVIFPVESPIEPAVYFGKWKSAIPTEVRVDVHDPTVSGDYYYSPLIWNDKDKRYYMTDKEPKSGRRPRR